jgi:hypothetical protein
MDNWQYQCEAKMTFEAHHTNDPYLDLAIQSTRRLTSLVQQDGKFIYKRDAISGLPLTGYNVLRHCGCVWAINLVAKEFRLGLEANQAARRAMVWLARNKIISLREGELCVADNGVIKLGGNALAVLALLTLSDFTLDDKEIIIGLCKYIHSQCTGVTFVHKRSITGEPHKFTSQYYTGQALFAVLAAGESLSDMDYFKWSRRTLKELLPSGFGLVQQCHWMMYAVDVCHRVVPEKFLTDYAARMADGIVERPFYRSPRRSTSIACRTEALLSCARVLSSEAEGECRLPQIKDAITKNLRLQLRDRLPNGDFRNGVDGKEIRVDYLQHNLLSFFFGHKLFARQTP